MKRRNFIKSIVSGLVAAASGKAIAKAVNPLTYDDLPMFDDGKLYNISPSHDAPLKNHVINGHSHEWVKETLGPYDTESVQIYESKFSQVITKEPTFNFSGSDRLQGVEAWINSPQSSNPMADNLAEDKIKALLAEVYK